MTQPLPDDVMDFLKANAPEPPLEDSDLTADRAAEAWGVGHRAAFSRLDLLVKQGKMTKVRKRDGSNHPVNVYVPCEIVK